MNGTLVFHLALRVAFLEEQVRRLSGLATRDALTGLGNRRAFDDLARRLASHARRHGLAVTVLMVDIDHFKAINDTHGHGYGDEILRRVAQLLQSSLRAMDTVFRFGGEEFVVVLPGIDAQNAQAVVERILEGVKAAGVTVSVGIASTTSQDLYTLIEEADHAMYQAKQSGRNRYCIGRGECAT